MADKRDIKTRFQGVYARHQIHCRLLDGGRCNCEPGYWASFYDRARGKAIKSPTFRDVDAARNWRSDMGDQARKGLLVTVSTNIRVNEAIERFIDGIKDGSIRNKRGQRYKLAAVRDYESALTVHVKPEIGRKTVRDVRRGDLQAIVDDMQARLSGSRVRSAVTACRAMWRWLISRELAAHNPAAVLELPAIDEAPIDWVPTPEEFERRLALLEPDDAVPFAIAGYATGRRSEIRDLPWADVDLDTGAIELAADRRGKTKRATRTVLAPRRCAPV
jgi:hypothetical protein